MKKKTILAMPFVQQVNLKATLAAYAEMILRHYGIETNQRDIYDKAKWGDGDKEAITDAGIGLALSDFGYRIVCWKNERSDAPQNWKDFEQHYWPQYWRAVKVGALEVKKDADIFLIKESIDKGVPVIADVDNGKLSGKQTTWTQPVLLIGYSNTHFTYHNSQEAKGAKTITFQKFSECWEQTPFVNKSMRVLVKKEAVS
ncbi:MAG: C39 family peptidase [Candidatus Aenigmarchaeota archaeon]|nr:C39 family peptidase [Candidatus Aenigmarchaeota archaeon]